MNLQLLCLGKCRDKYLQLGCAEFSKRIQPYAKLSITEIAEEKAQEPLSTAEQENLLHQEAHRIQKYIKPQTFLIALAIDGKTMSSEQFAHKLDGLVSYGQSHLTFVIGSSYGLSSYILKQADLLLSFSQMTFPHQLMRLILLEQIYRTCKINRGEIYHK